jgi:hypothetical protein
MSPEPSWPAAAPPPAAPGTPSVPVPPGPGVQPPFVAPPTDGTRRRRWWALGLAGAAVVVLCAGGVFGFGALVVFGSQMIVDQSEAAARNYLTAVQAERYEEAYALLCEREQARYDDEDDFADAQRTRPRLRSFTVLAPLIQEEDIVVPADLFYDDGSSDRQRFLIEQDTQTTDFEVCGQAD